MMLLQYIHREHAENTKKLCVETAERAFAPFPPPWNWAPHSCSVLTAFAPAFHGLADTHMPHCCCLLDKKKPDCNCPNYSSVPGVSQGRTGQLHAPSRMPNGKVMLLRAGSRLVSPFGLSVNRADNISNPSAQTNVQGDSGCFQ